MRKMTLGGVGWTEATGGPVIVEFERRRYGTGASSRTYTWGYVIAPDGSRLLLGDPWPKITPGRAEVEEAAWPLTWTWTVL